MTVQRFRKYLSIAEFIAGSVTIIFYILSWCFDGPK